MPTLSGRTGFPLLSRGTVGMFAVRVVTVCALSRFGFVCRWMSEGRESADVRRVICICDCVGGAPCWYCGDIPSTWIADTYSSWGERSGDSDSECRCAKWDPAGGGGIVPGGSEDGPAGPSKIAWGMAIEGLTRILDQQHQTDIGKDGPPPNPRAGSRDGAPKKMRDECVR